MDDLPIHAIDSEDRFEAAIEAVKKRHPVLKSEWEAMDRYERENAFTVAQVTEASVIQDVLDAITRAVEDGTDFEQFKDDCYAKLVESWGGEEIPGRLETIFRTNLMTAYNEGRHAIYSSPTVKEARPYLRCDGTDDDRMCELCAEYHGTIRPQEDWDKATMPLHYNCRHVLTPISAEEAVAEGIDDAMPDAEPDEGFGDAPSKAGEDWDFDLDRFSPELRTELEDRMSGKLKAGWAQAALAGGDHFDPNQPRDDHGMWTGDGGGGLPGGKPSKDKSYESYRPVADRADAATYKAKKAVESGDHKKAADEHRKAAEAHRKAADAAGIQTFHDHHEAMVKYHEDRAKQESERALAPKPQEPKPSESKPPLAKPASKPKFQPKAAKPAEPKRFDSELQMTKYEEKKSAEWAKGLEHSEKASIVDYTGDGYKPINSALRTGKLDDPAWAATKAKVAAIDSAIAKQTISEPLKVHRVGVCPADQLKVGAVVKDKGFVSTTLHQEKIYGRFQDLPKDADLASSGAAITVWKINVPKGAKAAIIGKVSQFSYEHEVLLGRDSSFKITHVEDRVEGTNVKRNVKVVYADLEG